MVKNIFIIMSVIITAVLASSFLFKNCAVDNSKGESSYLEVFKKGIRKEGLVVIGSGGGEKNGKEWLIEVSLFKDEVLNIDRGRELISGVVEEFLKAINEDEKIREHLIAYPFPVENICVSIHGKNHIADSSNKISLVRVFQGEVDYLADNPDGGRLITLLTETFQEAQERVKNNSQ